MNQKNNTHTRRSNREIEADFIKIREAAENAKSFVEVSKETGLSFCKIETSLAKHPKLAAKIRKQVEDNANGNMEYVLDTSIIGAKDVFDILRTYTNPIIISPVLGELAKFQHGTGSACYRARELMKYADKNVSVVFYPILDTETVDDSLLRFCKEDKEHRILITVDKELALKAKGMELKYTLLSAQQMVSFNGLEKIGDSYYYRPKKAELFQSVVIKDGIEYFKEQLIPMKNGDEVIIMCRKINDYGPYSTFAHYKIVDIDDTQNAALIFSKRIYQQSQIGEIATAQYRSLLRTFCHNN